MQNGVDLEMSNLLKAGLGLEHLANVTIRQARNDELLEASADSPQNAFSLDDVQVSLTLHLY